MNKPGLTEGLDPEHIEALGDLSSLEAQLGTYRVPDPDSAALLARLSARMNAGPPAPESSWRSWTRLAETQLSLLNARFWWATLFVLCLGAVLVAAYGGAMLVVYAFCSPVLAVAGTAYLFRPETRTIHEFELFSEYSPLELLYIRLLMVLVYTSGITLVLLLTASTQSAPIVLWRLLLIWIGPMIGLTGLALYTSLRWNAFAGVSLPMGLWVAIIALGWREMIQSADVPLSMTQTMVLAVSQSNGLLLAAVASLIGGFLLIWRVQGWVLREDGAD